jgi:hypothetical protein
MGDILYASQVLARPSEWLELFSAAPLGRLFFGRGRRGYARIRSKVRGLYGKQ